MAIAVQMMTHQNTRVGVIAKVLNMDFLNYAGGTAQISSLPISIVSEIFLRSAGFEHLKNGFAAFHDSS